MTQGDLSVAATSQGRDAAAPFYVDDYLPTFYEVRASMKAQKPTSGLEGQRVRLFDYFSPTDFKFAGIDVATNKLVMGHRTAGGLGGGRAEVRPRQLVADTVYDLLVSVNGPPSRSRSTAGPPSPGPSHAPSTASPTG